MTGMSAAAYDCEVDGLYYNLYGENAYVTFYSDRYYNNEDAYKGEITIPESIKYKGNDYRVTAIGYRAFYHCTNLKSVSLPNSITSIGIEAFHYCQELEIIKMSENIESIGEEAFYDCSKLNTIYIPQTVKERAPAEVSRRHSSRDLKARWSW